VRDHDVNGGKTFQVASLTPDRQRLTFRAGGDPDLAARTERLERRIGAFRRVASGGAGL
jgi:hypothetical protein